MKFKTPLFLLLFTIAGFTTKAQETDSLQIRKATDTFLNAFRTLDWNTFRNCFAADATVFFPFYEQRDRRIGKQEIEATWLELFPGFIDPNNKMEIRIDPRNILIQVYNNTGIVSFQLGMDDLSRRTFVFVKEAGMWKIVHLHASMFTKPE